MACIRFWQSSVIQSLNSLTVLKWKLFILSKCSSMSILVKRMITVSLKWPFHFSVGPARNATSHQASFCWHISCTMNLHFHTLIQGYPHKRITRVQNHYQFLPNVMLSQNYFTQNKCFYSALLPSAFPWFVWKTFKVHSYQIIPIVVSEMIYRYLI